MGIGVKGKEDSAEEYAASSWFHLKIMPYFINLSKNIEVCGCNIRKFGNVSVV